VPRPLPRAPTPSSLPRVPPYRPQEAVLVPTETIPDAPVIKGYDFSAGRDLDGLMAAMLTSGFQATALGQAVNEVNRMVRAAAAWGRAA
jgi:deoxyhypusine synthase